MKIDVLGTDYDFYFANNVEMEDSSNIGECDRYGKSIKINLEYFRQKNMKIDAIHQTIRHEVLHAFLHEAGLDCYAEDEILVDALAILFPKIHQCFGRLKYKEEQNDE